MVRLRGTLSIGGRRRHLGVTGALSSCLLVQVAGCYHSFGARFVLHPMAIGAASEPNSQGTLSDDDIEKAKGVAALVAEGFKMRPDTGAMGFRVPGHSEGEIASYFPTKESPASASDKEGVTLTVLLRDDRTFIEYLIRDLRNSSETKFSRALGRALHDKLEATFGKERISVGKHSDLMVLAP